MDAMYVQELAHNLWKCLNRWNYFGEYTPTQDMTLSALQGGNLSLVKVLEFMSLGEANSHYQIQKGLKNMPE